jgi:ribosomal protein S18 acetylase RimI-like enzyme
MRKASIKHFDTSYAKDFATLNYEWLDKHFIIEPHDIEMLDNVETYIIDRGGYILFAEIDDKIIGTVALIKISDCYFELAKMAVTEKYQNQKIGKQLLEAAIKFSKEKELRTLMLESNRTLTVALHLYKKYGFREVPVNPNSPYKRADIKMELHL